MESVKSVSSVWSGWTGRAAVLMALGIGTFTVGCGGGSGQGGGEPGAGNAAGTTSAAPTNDGTADEEASMTGVYAATYSGTYTVNSALGSQSGSNTATATIAVTDLGNGQIKAVWQLGSNTSGSIDFAMMGEDGTATGVPTGGSCFQGLIDGDNQTNCCTACSIAFSGTDFTQPNSGTMSGVSADGVPFTGTYSGQWVAQKQ
jgi:hypothetical protein